MREANLPSAPSFLLSKEAEYLRAVVGLVCDASGFGSVEERWQQVIEEYRRWEETFVGKHTSNLNRKLQLYQMLLAAFPNVELRNNPVLLDVILSTVRQPGETVTLLAPNSDNTTARIVRREITDRLGVLLTLQRSDGEMFTHELFD